MENAPDFLTLSPEKLAENERRDGELRLKFNTRLKISAAEVERARAAIIEREQRKTVQRLSTQTARARRVASAGSFDVLPTELDTLNEQYAQSKERLAESLASQGKYLDAARTTTDPVCRSEYKRIARAVWDEDAKPCKCAAPQAVVAGELLTLPKYRIVRRIFSIREAAETNLLACNECEKYMVTSTLPGDLQAIERARAASTAAKPITDVDIFRQK